MVYLICNSMPVFPREDDIEVNIEQEEQEVCKDLLNKDQVLFLFKNKKTNNFEYVNVFMFDGGLSSQSKYSYLCNDGETSAEPEKA